MEIFDDILRTAAIVLIIVGVFYMGYEAVTSEDEE